jgi:hypothetical protein
MGVILVNAPRVENARLPVVIFMEVIMPKLTMEQADAIESEMREMEADPNVDKHALRLFLQFPMPCGHAAGNLLTCDSPPFGCVICGEPDEVGMLNSSTNGDSSPAINGGVSAPA